MFLINPDMYGIIPLAFSLVFLVFCPLFITGKGKYVVCLLHVVCLAGSA